MSSSSPRSSGINIDTTQQQHPPPQPTRTSSPRHGLGALLRQGSSGATAAAAAAKHRSVEKDKAAEAAKEEELAEKNGDTLLLEVQHDAELADRFARLKTELEHENGGNSDGSGDVITRAPFLSGERFPFMKLLFREASGSFSGSGDILADENDAEKDDNPMVQIFLWKDPIVTGTWLTVINLGFFCMMFADMSLLTLGSFLALWQLLVDLCIVRLGPKLQQSGLVSPRFDFSAMVRKTRFFSPKLVKQYADAAHEVADMAIGFWHVVVMEGQWADIQFAGRFLFVVFLRSFSFTVTAYLLLVALFTLPISFNSNRVLTEALLEGWRLRWQAMTNRIRIWYEGFGSPVIVGASSPRRTPSGL